jgi:hypothetical protein
MGRLVRPVWKLARTAVGAWPWCWACSLVDIRHRVEARVVEARVVEARVEARVVEARVEARVVEARVEALVEARVEAQSQMDSDGQLESHCLPGMPQRVVAYVGGST